MDRLLGDLPESNSKRDAVMPPSALPTFHAATWTVTAFRDSLINELSRDSGGRSLSFYLYAVTDLGWLEIRDAVIRWRDRQPHRVVRAYIGTDHGLTEPDVLSRLRTDRVDVWLPTKYEGIFHPKVVALELNGEQLLWIGSNNLTRDSLRHNIECAALIRTSGIPTTLGHWFRNIHAVSEALTDELLASYREERAEFARARVNAGAFVWSRREQPLDIPSIDGGVQPSKPTVTAGDLIIEIMPRETGLEGKQVQIPKAAAISFFHLRNRIGASRTIELRHVDSPELRRLTLTLFANHTVRLSLAELDYRHRPCVIRFHVLGATAFEYEVVQRAIFPSRYKDLLSLCTNRTSTSSRRWAILPT